MFGQGDSDDRDNTRFPHYLQMGKLRHKPGSAAALQKGYPFPQHPIGHTEGVKVIYPPNLPGLQKGSGDIVSCRGVQSHALLPGPCTASPAPSPHPRKGPGHPAPHPGNGPRHPAPHPRKGPGIPHLVAAEDPAVPAGAALTCRGPGAGGAGGPRPGPGPGLRSLRSARSAPAGQRRRARPRARACPSRPLPWQPGWSRCCENHPGGGRRGEWTPPLHPRARAHPEVPHCRQPQPEPPAPDPRPGHPSGCGGRGPGT